MKLPRTAILLSLASLQTGCSMYYLAAKNLINEPIVFCDDLAIRHQNRKEAKHAWQEYAKLFPQCAQSDSFGEGFVDGFTDYLNYGLITDPPPAPKLQYTRKAYLTFEGHVATEEWYAGFSTGAKAAQASGLREVRVFHLQPAAIPNDTSISPSPPALQNNPPAADQEPGTPVPPASGPTVLPEPRPVDQAAPGDLKTPVPVPGGPKTPLPGPGDKMPVPVPGLGDPKGPPDLGPKVPMSQAPSRPASPVAASPAYSKPSPIPDVTPAAGPSAGYVRAAMIPPAPVRRQETGDRRQETGDRRQETGDRSQEPGAIARPFVAAPAPVPAPSEVVVKSTWVSMVPPPSDKGTRRPGDRGTGGQGDKETGGLGESPVQAPAVPSEAVVEAPPVHAPIPPVAAPVVQVPATVPEAVTEVPPVSAPAAPPAAPIVQVPATAPQAVPEAPLSLRQQLRLYWSL